MFPVVFHPVAPPKSIALDSGKKKKKMERRERTTDVLSIKTLEDISLTHGEVDFVPVCRVSFRAQTIHRRECDHKVQRVQSGLTVQVSRALP